MKKQRGLSRFEDIQQKIDQRIADIEKANEEARKANGRTVERQKEKIITKLTKRMKKLFLAIIAMLLPLVGATAQSHWTFDENQWQSETVVYCDLVSQLATVSVNPTIFEVAAFVDDEVRAVATLGSFSNVQCFRLRVKGNADTDTGKEITFRAYNTRTQLEYNVTLVEEPLPIKWDGETPDPGTPGNLRHLYIAEVTSISLPQTITIAKGETVNLLDYVTVLPEGATLSSSAVYTWDVGNSAPFISVSDDNQLTGLAPTNEAWLGLTVGTLSASTNVIVTNPATALTILDDFKEITVNKGDNATLTKMIESSYELTPADATDQVVWTIADETIVQYSNSQWNPIAAGTTTMTAQILNADGSVRLSATLTVHVVVPVESMWFDFGDLGYYPKYIQCNVGDDLTEFFTSHLTILPEDATNKAVTWSVSGNDGIISLASDGSSITAVGPGWVTISATSVENPQLQASYYVEVDNPATDVAFEQETLNINYEGSLLDISEQVINNISFLPTGFDSVYNLEITSDNEDVVQVEKFDDEWMYRDRTGNLALDLSATALKPGEATVTVSFTYTDWLGTYTNPNGNNDVTIEKTFKIVVSEHVSVSGFIMKPSDLVFNEEGTLYVSPQPEGADFDETKLAIHIVSPYRLSEDWEQTITGGEDLGDELYAYTFTPMVPGTNTVEFYYDGNLISTQRVEVPARLSLADGWQWTTLYYGSVDAQNMPTAFGGDNLVEIRSQYELLYNDPSLGYFGELADNGIRQDECYKVKMQGTTDDYLLYGGSIVRGWQQDVNTGWTWIPNPYLYPRFLSRITGAQEGDRIVSKDNGFAEYDGSAWVGSLSMFTPGDGYLYYSENGGQIQFTNEFDLSRMLLYHSSPNGNDRTIPNDPVKPGAKRFARGIGDLPWQYDASAFRDNMSIVAVAENADDLTDGYSVGAFVGDQCRGEGILLDGRLFITVHGQAGEQVSFRFYDPLGREFFDARQTIRFQQVLGSLKAPLTLTKIGQATDIRQIDNSRFTDLRFNGQLYDLSGRKIVNRQSVNRKLPSGLYIVDGKKVVVK